MPYTVSNPPDRIQNLPKGAQSIWIAAYNASYDGTCAERDDREACANKIAYAAVKNKYEQDAEGEWHLKEGRMKSITQLWEQVKRLFIDAGLEIERNVVDVENWDGAASNYSSTEAYCDACLINVNDGAAEDWTQNKCKLPVLKPGGTAYVRQAIHSAAVALAGGRTPLARPDGVLAADWNAALKKAANELITAYNQADEQAPDSVYEVAGKKPPERSISTVSAPATRTITMSLLHQHIYERLEELNAPARQLDANGMVAVNYDEYYQPMEIYYDDDGALFVLANRMGRLYRIPVQVATSEAGESDVTLGEILEIPLTPRARNNSLQVYRTAHGEARWFGVAASAVLNRDGQIDSTKLFDNFIRRAQVAGEYPVLSFYHHKDILRFGQARWLARDGFLYLAAGTFDDTPDGRAVATNLERQQENWGMSIRFLPVGLPELLEIMPDVHIPVFNDGINNEISIVLERDAAAHFTHVGAQEVIRTMKPNELDALIALLGGDAQARARAQEIAAQVDGTNRTITQEGLIARTQAPAAQTNVATAPLPQAAPEPVPAAPTPQTRQVELDDELLTALAQSFAQSPAWLALETSVAQINATLGELIPAVNANTSGLEAAQAAAETRLRALERDETEKQRQWQQDLPAAPVRYSYRPREARAPQLAPGEVASMEVAAQDTLARMKTRQPQAQ